MRPLLWHATLAGVLVCLGGCGSSAPRTCAESGTVTVDGEPLDDGEILLEPMEAGVGPDFGKVVDGKFAFRAKPGSKRVVIRASRLVPGSKGLYGEALLKNYLPARYNAQSSLSAVARPTMTTASRST
jgi:hypothetical protein